MGKIPDAGRGDADLEDAVEKRLLDSSRRPSIGRLEVAPRSMASVEVPR